MDAFAKMDIFFLVTTIAVVVLAIFVGVLLFYILRTARDVSEAVRIGRREIERFAKGTSAARNKIQGAGGTIVQSIIGFIQSFSKTKKSKK